MFRFKPTEISIVLAPPRTLLLPCECVEVRSRGDQCSWHHDPVAPHKRHHRKEANNASSLDPSIDRSAAHLASFRPAPCCSPRLSPTLIPRSWHLQQLGASAQNSSSQLHSGASGSLLTERLTPSTLFVFSSRLEP